MQFFYEHTLFTSVPSSYKNLLRGSRNTESVQRLQKLLFLHVKSQHHRSAYVPR